MTAGPHPAREKAGSSGRSRVFAALLAALVTGACSDEPAPTDKGKDAAAADVNDDVIVWADVGSKDTWSPIIDTNAPAEDTGMDVPVSIDTGVDVALPKPATVPTDLPPDVQAFALPGTALEEDGKTKVAKLVLPTGTVSFLAVVQGAHPGHFAIATAVNPKGDLLGKGQCQPFCTSCSNPIAALPATGAVLFPNSSKVAVTGGTWHLSSCGFVWKQEGNQYSTQPLGNAAVQTFVLARVRPDGQVPATGTLKVRLWLAGNFPNAAQSFDDPITSVMLAGAATALQTADIELAVIDRINLPPTAASIAVPDGLTTDHSSNADKLFEAAAAVGGSAVLDVFVVDTLVGGKEGGVQLAGWSGGRPGPVSVAGKPRAGIVIARAQLLDGAHGARVLAHEIGHYLGLFDSTSADGGADPLDSTVTCPVAGAGDDGVLTAAECAGKGGNNAMFWLPDNAPATFTVEQGRILRGNPMVWPK